jgi:PAS domain-containing protein
MSKKRLLNRLDSLFSNIEEVQPVALPVDTSHPTGWSWECDLTGKFTSCSPEVTYFMGSLPEEFIGKTIFDFKVHPQSVELLTNAISGDTTQGEIIIQYETNAGWLAVRAHIRPQRDNGTTSGYQVFNELL